MSTSSYTSFNPVVVALFSIFLMCGIYIGYNEDVIPNVTAGLGFFIWGALPHFGCLIASYRIGKTNAAVVLMIFTGFWTLLSISLLAGLKKELGPLFLYSEPVIAISVFVMSYYYFKDKERPLGGILIGLGLTVSILWVSKALKWSPHVGSITVGILGFFVLLTAINQLNRKQA